MASNELMDNTHDQTLEPWILPCMEYTNVAETGYVMMPTVHDKGNHDSALPFAPSTSRYNTQATWMQGHGGAW
jgi:hypothetical protein